MSWQLLSDEVLFRIFSFVSAVDLLKCAQCCSSWNRVSLDEFLWKNLFYNDWNLKRSVKRNGKRSWRKEYERLKYHAPTVETEVLTEHTNHVLHVCFSHNGKMFATCSRDGVLILWNSTYPATVFQKINLSFYGWHYAQFSKFNESDTLLMVCGEPRHSVFISRVVIFNIELTIRPATNFFRWEKENYDWFDDMHIVSSHKSCLENRCTYQLHYTDEREKRITLFTFQDTRDYFFIIANQLDHPYAKYIIFIMNHYPSTQLGFKSLVEPEISNMEKLNMHGHVTGLAISTNHEYLYVNVVPRAFSESFEQLESYEIHTRVIDLRKRQDIGVLYRFKPNFKMNRYYFYHPIHSSDVSDEFVACGGIDDRAYLLDRHYGVCVSTFPHDDKVNSVAINPKDPEMVVTAGNDFKLKIWYSRNREKEFKTTRSD